MAGVAYYFLAQCLVAVGGPDSTLGLAVGRDRKGLLSIAFYVGAIALSFADPRAALGIYVLVAALWFIHGLRLRHRLAELVEVAAIRAGLQPLGQKKKD